VAVVHHKGKVTRPVNKTRAVEILRRVDTPDALWYAYEILAEAADLQRAAVLGSPEAQHRLATTMLEREQSIEPAATWLMRAASNGHEPSRTLLRELLPGMHRRRGGAAPSPSRSPQQQQPSDQDSRLGDL
jgi:TPR repeat protein